MSELNNTHEQSQFMNLLRSDYDMNKRIENTKFNSDSSCFVVHTMQNEKNVRGACIISSHNKYSTLLTQNTFIPNEYIQTPMNRYCQLDYIYVSEEHRKKGLGSMLLSECKNYAQSRNEQLHIHIQPHYLEFILENGFTVFENKNGILHCVY